MFLMKMASNFSSIAFILVFLQLNFISNAVYHETGFVTHRVVLHDKGIDALDTTEEITSVVLGGIKFHCSHSRKSFKKQMDSIFNALNNIRKSLEEMTCLDKFDFYWLYRFCPFKAIIQITPNNQDKKFSLGVYDSDSYFTKEVHSFYQKGEKIYYSQKFENGTYCNLSGRNRTTEVRFICQHFAEDELISVQEESVCSYVFYVVTNRVCAQLELEPEKMMQISCFPEKNTNVPELVYSKDKNIIEQENYMRFEASLEKEKPKYSNLVFMKNSGTNFPKLISTERTDTKDLLKQQSGEILKEHLPDELLRYTLSLSKDDDDVISDHPESLKRVHEMTIRNRIQLLLNKVQTFRTGIALENYMSNFMKELLKETPSKYKKKQYNEKMKQ